MILCVHDLIPTDMKRLHYPALKYAQEVRRVAVEAFRKNQIDWACSVTVRSYIEREQCKVELF